MAMTVEDKPSKLKMASTIQLDQRSNEDSKAQLGGLNDNQEDIKNRQAFNITASDFGDSVIDQMPMLKINQNKRFNSIINERPPQDFWNKFEAHKKATNDYKNLSEFYLTKSLIKREKDKNSSPDNMIIRQIQAQNSI